MTSWKLKLGTAGDAHRIRVRFPYFRTFVDVAFLPAVLATMMPEYRHRRGEALRFSSFPDVELRVADILPPPR